MGPASIDNQRTVRLLAFLVVAVVAPLGAAFAGPVDDARSALDAKDYDRAAGLAMQALEAAPGDGQALFVLGLARFRVQRFAEALQAFDAAGRSPEGPARPLLAYNRGSALYELGRYDEAERSFLDAAAGDAELAPLAILNAGYAARDAGDDARARRHAARAAALPGGEKVADMASDLRADLDGGGAPVAGGEGGAPIADEPTPSGAVASAPKPGGAALLDQALDLLHKGDRPAARRGFEEALSLGLPAEDREVATDFVDALTPGLRSRGRGLELRAVAGSGYDSLVAQSGVARTEANNSKYAERGAGFGSATIDLALRFPIGGGGFGEVAFGFDQLAYLTDKFDDFSLQEHELSTTFEGRIAQRLRASLRLAGQVLFTGLGKFAAFERSATVAPELALDESDAAATRIAGAYSGKQTFKAADSFYDGTRTDLTLGQDLRVGRGLFSLGLRRRLENIGTQIDSEPPPGIAQRCPRCTYVIPFAYKSNAADLQWQSRVGQKFRLGAYAGVEARKYDADSYLQIPPVLGREPEWDHRRRKDTRLSGGLAAGVLFGSSFEATLRWDLIVNRSNIDNTKNETCAPPGNVCHQLDYDNKNYKKNLVTIELSADW